MNSPKILYCPGDHTRRHPVDWDEFREADSSYEIVTPDVREADTNTAYLRCKIHGHVGYADATVFDGKERRTKKLF